MRNKAPELLPVLRSRTQAALLTLTLLNPDREFVLTDLAARIGASTGTTHAEVERLERAGALASRYLGRSRLIRAGSGPLVKPLTDLVQIAFGPRSVGSHL